MERGYELLDRLVALLIIALVCVVLLIILSRQIGLSMVWAYDLARWLMIWLVFYGAVSLTGRGLHLTIELVAHALPGRVRVLGQMLGAISTIGLALVIAYYGSQEVWRMHLFNERSMSGRFPAALGYSVLPLAFGLLAIAAAHHLIKCIRMFWRNEPGKLPPHGE